MIRENYLTTNEILYEITSNDNIKGNQKTH